MERLAAVSADDDLAVRDIWVLRLRALLARAQACVEPVKFAEPSGARPSSPTPPLRRSRWAP